jgi:hypothetical protein
MKEPDKNTVNVDSGHQFLAEVVWRWRWQHLLAIKVSACSPDIFCTEIRSAPANFIFLCVHKEAVDLIWAGTGLPNEVVFT